LTVFGDLRSGYVDGQRSLLSQGFSQPQVYLMLSASPNFVWHPATPTLTRMLDQEAQSIFSKAKKPVRKPTHRAPGHPRPTPHRPSRRRFA
jgi:hypothetical protein